MIRIVNEMSTVGYFTTDSNRKADPRVDYQVLTTSDGGYPQVHIHILHKFGNDKKKSKDRKVFSCIKLDKPEYFLHGKYKDTLTDDELQGLIDFFNSPSKQKYFTVGNEDYKIRTFWDYSIATWNEENIAYPQCQMEISKDKDGYIIVPKMPDYTLLFKSNRNKRGSKL